MDKGYFLYPSDGSKELEYVETVRKICSRVTDNISKELFVNKLLYSITLEPQYVRNSVLLTQVGVEFEQMLSKASMKPILIYGAGKRGKQLVELFPEKNWKGYIDKKKKGYCNGLEIRTIEQYSNILESIIVISNQSGYEEIKNELINIGLDESDIIILEEWNKKAAQNQYFEKRCIEIDDIQGDFVDVGSFDGSDSLSYIERKENNYSRIWAFEPDNMQYEVCKKRLLIYERATVYNMGVSDKSKNEKMIMMHNLGSYIANKDINWGGVEIKTVSLDEILRNENIEYIKMDIEGYEERAILGAKDIIKNKHPRLAVCIYHKRDDIWRIPSLLLKLNPEYRFAIGHYSVGQVDTVLYAY